MQSSFGRIALAAPGAMASSPSAPPLPPGPPPPTAMPGHVMGVSTPLGHPQSLPSAQNLPPITEMLFREGNAWAALLSLHGGVLASAKHASSASDSDATLCPKREQVEMREAPLAWRDDTGPIAGPPRLLPLNHRPRARRRCVDTAVHGN